MTDAPGDDSKGRGRAMGAEGACEFSGDAGLAEAARLSGRPRDMLGHLADGLRGAAQSRAWEAAAAGVDACEVCACEESDALAQALALALAGLDAWRSQLPTLAALRIRNIVGALALDLEREAQGMAFEADRVSARRIAARLRSELAK